MIKKSDYSEKLKDPRWQKKRLEVFNRDEFKCTLCGDEKTTLHVHHEKYDGDPWDVDLIHLKTLCYDCHSFTHYLEDISKKDFEIIKILKDVEGKVMNITAIGSDETITSIVRNGNYGTTIIFKNSFFNKMVDEINNLKNG